MNIKSTYDDEILSKWISTRASGSAREQNIVGQFKVVIEEQGLKAKF